MTDVSKPSAAGRFLIMAAALVVLIWGMHAAADKIVLVLLAVFLSVILAPLLSSLNRRGMPKWAALLVVLASVLVAGLLFTAIVAGSIDNFREAVPEYRKSLGKKGERLYVWRTDLAEMVPKSFKEYIPWLAPRDEDAAATETKPKAEAELDKDAAATATETKPAEAELDKDAAATETKPKAEPETKPKAEPETKPKAEAELDKDAAATETKAKAKPETKAKAEPQAKTETEARDVSIVLSLVGDMLTSIGGLLANAFLIFLILVFICLEASSFPRKIRATVPEVDRQRILSGLTGFLDNLNRYTAIKTGISIVTGLLAGGWCALIGIDNPILWGLLAFLLNYVPNIGSIMAAVPPVLLAYIQYDWPQALYAAVGFGVINIVIGNVLEPRFMGRGLGMSTLVVFLSLVFWGWVLGPVGMLLSIPLTMTVKIALENQEETRWLAVWMGSEDKPAEPPERPEPEAQA